MRTLVRLRFVQDLFTGTVEVYAERILKKHSDLARRPIVIF